MAPSCSSQRLRCRAGKKAVIRRVPRDETGLICAVSRCKISEACVRHAARAQLHLLAEVLSALASCLSPDAIQLLASCGSKRVLAHTVNRTARIAAGAGGYNAETGSAFSTVALVNTKLTDTFAGRSSYAI
jgi:hypothetical protein